MILRSACQLLALGLWLLPVAARAQSTADGGLTADVHTLLLERFEDDIQRADFSLGMSKFAGNGARQVPGYYGQGIDLRRRGLEPDFMTKGEGYTPRQDGWGFHSRGNVSPWQGTLECWFQPSDPRQPRLVFSGNFLNAELNNTVRVPDKDRYGGFSLTLNRFGVRYFLPTVAGNVFTGDINFKTLPGYASYLEPENWHHFAMTWDQGALVIYLDGRRLISHDMTGQKGLALVSSPVRYLNMSDMVLDELRISNIVRYPGEFEPAWRDGERPAHAYPGDREEAPAYPARAFHTLVPSPMPAADGPAAATVEQGDYTLTFAADGSLLDLAIADLDVATSGGRGGLMLRSGVRQIPLAPRAMSRVRWVDGHARFDQRFDGSVTASHDLSLDPNGALRWRVTMRNDGVDEIWLEPLMSLGLPLRGITEIFDGVEPRVGENLRLPRHRAEYGHALPFVAATDGERYVGLGVDPHVDMSELIGEWLPESAAAAPTLRQGTRVALSPGEHWALDFIVVHGVGEFGVLDAVDGFHDCFPDLYRLRSDVTVYTYMPMTQYAYSDPYFDMKRLGWAGNFWGHGPGHDKGDEYGTPRWWDNPELYDKKAYARYTRRLETMWGSPMTLREVLPLTYRRSYDNWYPVRRFHTCPDLTPGYIIEQTWPGYVPNDDPLCFGQYYEPTYGWLLVNEYNTPVGAHIQEQARRYMLATAGYSPGFINDMSHAGSLFRHTDPIARVTNGRAWASDLGCFVRKAVGRRQRYEILNETVMNGTRLTIWSDGGSFSYTLGAFSAGIAIEGSAMYRDLSGSATYVESARYLIGEKPFSAMTHLNDDWIGYFLAADDFPTAASLRDYYRYAGRQLMLWCIRQGVSLDPASYMYGRQAEHELNPLLVESTVRGRRLVPAATVDEALFVVRAGRDLDTLFVIGNTHPRPLESQLRVHGHYFGDWQPLLARYHGGELSQARDGADLIVSGLELAPRDALGLFAVAQVQTAGALSATSRLSGDGISLTLELDLELAADAAILLSQMAPVYELASLTVNSETPIYYPGEPLALAAGSQRLVLQYRTPHLDFTAADWEAVELIRDGQTNVVIVGEPSTDYVVREESPRIAYTIGFEAGTLGMLNDFLAQYDSENGVRGDLAPAAVLESAPDDWQGWVIQAEQVPGMATGAVTIDRDARRITVRGPTAGERRRAMVVWLRLLDRKYPHVGRYHTFMYRKKKWDNSRVDFEKWVKRAPTRAFYRAFVDPLFLAKPILDPAYESLYADGNMDFAGAYQLKTPPFLVEPTADDDFVYGYRGDGKASTREMMLRNARQPDLEAANEEDL